MTLDLTQWLEIANGIGTIGLLMLGLWFMRRDNTQAQKDLTAERNARIQDLKAHNSSTESLLEKVLVALQDNQKFLDKSLNDWKQEIKDALGSIKGEIPILKQELKDELNSIKNEIKK